MEPLFFKAENVVTLVRSGFSYEASMEPLFFKAENGKARRTRKNSQSLQWSRFFSKRKISYPVQSRANPVCASMEPLFFKAENAASPSRTRRRPVGFNGAAFFQSGK